uniref:Sorting nexin 19b n=1 Tax=Erpetoichthys calabaricus TaxID=27687 RepID=A0A8C4SVP8_ERPCA
IHVSSIHPSIFQPAESEHRVTGVCWSQSQPTQAATIVDTGLADATLNLLCLLMKDHWSWMCTENIQKTIRIFFAPLIERWLDVHIANLTCTQQWVTYLRILQEAIWPGGSLPVRPKPVHTDEQKEQTKILSLQCLTDLLPDFFQTMLGVEKYQLTWQLILESLQDPTVNRYVLQIIYCHDVLSEFVGFCLSTQLRIGAPPVQSFLRNGSRQL